MSSRAYTAIDHNPSTVQLVKVGAKLYQRHSNGQIWKFNDSINAPHWSMVSGNDRLLAIAGSPKHLYKLRTSGELLRLNDTSGKFEVIRELSNVKDVIASEKNFYYVLAGQGESGIAIADIDDPSPSYAELQKLYKDSKTSLAASEAENARLRGIKQADDKLIAQLHSDYDAAKAQIATLTVDLKKARDDAATEQKALNDQIASLQKNLLTAKVAEVKLANELDEEKREAHEIWKKAQEHDAADHKALADSQAALARSNEHATALQKQVDALTQEVSGLKDVIRILEAAVSEAQKKEALAEAELKKHLNDDLSEEIIIDGLEKVIQGLKKEVKGQEELLGVYKKQLGKSFH